VRTKRAQTPVAVKIAAALAVLVPLTLGIARHVDRVGNQHRLEKVASQIAGRPVEVRCPGVIASIGPDTNAGEVKVDADGVPDGKTTLRKGPCTELDALAEGRRRAQLACVLRSTSCGDDAILLAHSVDALAHESFHMKGVLHEGVTECFAMQTIAWTAMQLGTTEAEGRALARLHWETTYQRLPEEYQAPGCSDGGPFDLHPQDPRWP
jgi:hypothetical protein